MYPPTGHSDHHVAMVSARPRGALTSNSGDYNVSARNATPVTPTTPVLCAVLLAAFSMPLSFTGPAVATPAIGAALAGSPIELKWITNAFMLAFGSTLMAAGAIADRAG